MNAPIRELPRTEVPRPLVLVAATLCGVLAAIAAQIVLAQRGIELAGVWRELLSARGLQLRAAGAWWGMAASAFLAGAVVAARAQPFPPALAALPAAALDCRRESWSAALAHIGHAAAMKAGIAVGIHAAASFAAVCAAAADGAVRGLFRRQALTRPPRPLFHLFGNRPACDRRHSGLRAPVPYSQRRWFSNVTGERHGRDTWPNLPDPGVAGPAARSDAVGQSRCPRRWRGGANRNDAIARQRRGGRNGNS